MKELHDSCYEMIRNLSRDLTLAELDAKKLQKAVRTLFLRVDPLLLTEEERDVYQSLSKQLTDSPEHG